jgi:transposase
VEDEEMESTLAAGGPRQEVEVLAQAKRRRFTLEYKREILREADRCSKPGETGALLRREGLYSSHLSAWRAARDRGELGGRGNRKRGPEAKALEKNAKRIAELERENRGLRKRAERAEALVEVQKKLSELLGTSTPASDERS